MPFKKAIKSDKSFFFFLYVPFQYDSKTNKQTKQTPQQTKNKQTNKQKKTEFSFRENKSPDQNLKNHFLEGIFRLNLAQSRRT